MVFIIRAHQENEIIKITAYGIEGLITLLASVDIIIVINVCLHIHNKKVNVIEIEWIHTYSAKDMDVHNIYYNDGKTRS